MKTVIVLPNQLFEDNKLIDKNTTVYIYEHPTYFTLFKYHKLKLILHRSSMKYYEDYLIKKYKCHVTYIDFNKEDTFRKIFNNNIRIDIYDPVDHDAMKELKNLSKGNNIELFVHNTPLFLCTVNDLQSYLDNNGKYHQTSFYIWQRKRLNILIDKNQKPVKNKWTFDNENRLPFPENYHQDQQFKINNDKYVKEAQSYVQKHFKNNIGDIDLYLPINYHDVKKHLHTFIKNKLSCFGPYQDAVDKNINFGCHSVLSPLLNIGLITPQYVVDEIIKYYNNHKTILNSVEAIIRQIIGWREMVRFVYMFKHKELIKSNHFNHKRKIPKEWFTGEKITMVPINDIIQKVVKYGYAHHIERLMYLSNFMLLNMYKPTDIYNWFMTFFIDSYNWVMEPNVYAMGQYSTGPLMMTRPYFSSSNYIDKMSSYKKKHGVYAKIIVGDGDYEWYEIWNALYYNFINENKKELSQNYATASSVSHWNNKNNSEKKHLLDIARQYLENY